MSLRFRFSITFLMKYWLPSPNWHEAWADRSKWKQSGTWLLPCVGMSSLSFLLIKCRLVRHQGWSGGWGGFIGSVPWISLFKVSLIFFLSFFSICRLTEFISGTCFTYFLFAVLSGQAVVLGNQVKQSCPQVNCWWIGFLSVVVGFHEDFSSSVPL